MAGDSDYDLSHPVSVDVLPSSGLKIELIDNDENKAVIADRLNLLKVEDFKAELFFKRWRRDGVIVKGRIFSKITQECVVSLQSVENEVTETFEHMFLPEGSTLAKPRLNSDGELVLDPDGDDIPDLFTGKTLEAWEIIFEHLELAIDPFPRAEGVDVSQYEASEEELQADKPKSPFAVLETLKNKK